MKRFLVIPVVLLLAAAIPAWGLDGRAGLEPAACTLVCTASASPESGEAPLTVSFGAEAIPSDCSGAVAYNWEFGDGHLSGEQNPVHTYNSIGTFTWLVTAWAQGVSCSQTGTITVDPPPTCTLTCSATASADSGNAPLGVSFAADAEPSNCTGAVAYNWEFGDGNLSGVQNPEHTYNSVGTFTWTMTAWIQGKSCSRSGTVAVDPPPSCSVTCTASADPASGTAPLAVAFTAEAIPTNCVGGIAYDWDFGDGSLSGEQNPLHTYDEPGTCSWILNVWVGGVNCSETGTVQVQSAEVLPGDCDENGTVTIGEVQRVIRMHLRLDPPDCRADCDLDGIVSIGEVQKAIRAHLRMPVTC